MKRFAIKDYGPAEAVFEEIDAQQRELTDSRIRVEIKAFSVNPYDVSLRSGAMKEMRTLKFPYVPGNDGAGIVTEIAPDVKDFKVGDRVVVHAVGGTYGEEVVLPAKKATIIPEKMSWSEAAGMVTTGITAYNLLNHLLTLKPSDVVMVQGASGGVGSMLVQLLNEKNIKVLASASKRNEEKVKELGVSAFAAYDEVDPGEIFEDKATIVIDATKGSRKGKEGIQIMKENGKYIALNDLPDEGLRAEKSGYYASFTPKKEYEDKEAFEGLIKSYEAGKLKIAIAEILPFKLESVIEAHKQLEGHPSAGKIVIERL
ncbi:GroES-like protein [Enterococcus faecalis 13-SD-W-01]|nr:GroES-like protein [Enterococcus faecalis 13-SD-W-01]